MSRKIKAELAYALHTLEREIAIAQNAQAQLASQEIELARCAEVIAQYRADATHDERVNNELRVGIAEARKGEDEQTERAFQAEKKLASARKLLTDEKGNS